MSDKVMKIGLEGVMRGLENLARDAAKTVNAFRPDSTEDPLPSIIGMKVDEFQIKASAKVIKVGKDLNDAILDIFA